MHIQQAALDNAVAQLRRVQSESGVSLATAMEQLIDAVISMFGLTGAGLMLVDDDQLVRSVLATDDLGWRLDHAQEQAREGPCVEAVVYGELVATENVVTDHRWSTLGALLEDSPIRGVLGVPIRLAGATVGALNVHVDRPHTWDDSDRHALTTFGLILESLLSTALFAEQRDAVVTQLQEALESRVVIERCVGLLMGRDGVDAATAFNELRDIARPNRRKVHELAAEILATHG